MAWPCISRVCCLARRWNQLDRSDVAVPLTVHSYSDIEDPPPPPGPPPGAPAPGPPGSPGPPLTQYQRDFGAPRRDPQPWPRPGPGPAQHWCGHVAQLPPPPEANGRGGRPWGREGSCEDSLAKANDSALCPRQEYRPWPGTKPSRPVKNKPTSIIVTDYSVKESSYRADFKVPEGRRKFSPNPSAVFQASPAPILHV
uniref:MAP6 domain containing 1 n=1 Tax=Monodelphis domestica TaxID=13616 RepID=F6T346_MONDO